MIDMRDYTEIPDTFNWNIVEIFNLVTDITKVATLSSMWRLKLKTFTKENENLVAAKRFPIDSLLTHV